MKSSIIVVGPKGCGKTVNAPRIMKAFGLSESMDAAENLSYRPLDVLYLYHETPKKSGDLKIVDFDVAMQAVHSYEAR